MTRLLQPQPSASLTAVPRHTRQDQLTELPAPADQAPLVSADSLSKTYPGTQTPAVHELSFAIEGGETLAILGPSGCGKTTTLRMLAGFEVPDTGELRFQGTVVSGSRWVPPERRGIGMVFQQSALFPHLTVLANVAYGLQKLSAAEREKRAKEALALVDMAEYGERLPHALSGGQQQRVALARALAPRPVLLLMDEPFASLDAALRREMRREVKAILEQTGATSVVVTHDQEEAFALADRVLVMYGGRLQQLNSPDNVYHRPANRFVAGFVGQACYLPAHVEHGRVVTELGSFRYNGSTPDGDMDLLLRPDDVDIVFDGDCWAQIVDREFRRAYNRYLLELPTGRRVISTQPTKAVYTVGDAVRLRVNPEHVILFPHEEGPPPRLEG